jgi:hypothetical protein
MSETRPGFITVETYAAEPRLPKKWKNGHKTPGRRSAYAILAEGIAPSPRRHISTTLFRPCCVMESIRSKWLRKSKP